MASEITFEAWAASQRPSTVITAISQIFAGEPQAPFLRDAWLAGVRRSDHPLLDAEIKRFGKLYELLQTPWGQEASKLITENNDIDGGVAIFMKNGLTECPSCDGQDLDCPVTEAFNRLRK